MPNTAQETNPVQHDSEAQQQQEEASTVSTSTRQAVVEDTPTEVTKAKRCKNLQCIIICVVIAAYFVIMAWVFRTHLQDYIDELIQESQDDPTRLCFMLLGFYVVTLLIMCPPVFIIIFSTFAFVQLWGFWKGIGLSFLLNWILSNFVFMLGFVMGKYMCRKCVNKHLVQKNETLKLLNKAVKRHGAKVTALMRASAIIPQHPISYSMACSDISTWGYIKGNQGFVPLTFIYMHIGATSAEVTNALYQEEETSSWSLVITCLFMLLLLVAMCWMGKTVKKELDEYKNELKLEEASQDSAKKQLQNIDVPMPVLEQVEP